MIVEPYFTKYLETGHDHFQGQFLIHRENTTFFENWHIRNLTNWKVEIHPKLSLIELYGINRVKIGLVIGYFIGKFEKKILLEKLTGIEAFLKSIEGRFICIVTGDTNRIYTDSTASLTALYHSEKQVVSSSIFLLLSIFPKLAKHKLSSFRQIEKATGYLYPMGLTPVRNNRLLLANHYLNLDTFLCHRLEQKLEQKDTICDPIGKIAGLISQTLTSLSAENKLQILLSGGKDSRMILAIASKYLSDFRIGTYFSGSREDSNFRDLQTAIELSSIVKKPLDKFDLNRQYRYSSDSDHIIVVGFGGELGRSDYYQRLPSRKLEPSDVLAIFGLQTMPSFIKEAFILWFDEVSNKDSYQILDLCYIEIVMSCLNNPFLYRFDLSGKFSISPFSTFKAIHELTSLEVTFKQHFFQEIMRNSNPDLLQPALV